MIETLEASHVDAWADAARSAIDARLGALPFGELDDFWRIVAITYCRGPASPAVAEADVIEPVIAAAALRRVAAGGAEMMLPIVA